VTQGWEFANIRYETGDMPAASGDWTIRINPASGLLGHLALRNVTASAGGSSDIVKGYFLRKIDRVYMDGVNYGGTVSALDIDNTVNSFSWRESAFGPAVTMAGHTIINQGPSTSSVDNVSRIYGYSVSDGKWNPAGTWTLPIGERSFGARVWRAAGVLDNGAQAKLYGWFSANIARGSVAATTDTGGGYLGYGHFVVSGSSGQTIAAFDNTASFVAGAPAAGKLGVQWFANNDIRLVNNSGLTLYYTVEMIADR
jgi:hypothetical protein